MDTLGCHSNQSAGAKTLFNNIFVGLHLWYETFHSSSAIPHVASEEFFKEFLGAI